MAALFAALDTDGNGSLSFGETLAFAVLLGFDGDAVGWGDGWRQTCADVGADCALGLAPAMFERLLDTDWSCSDDELVDLLAGLQPESGFEPGGVPHEVLVDAAAAPPAHTGLSVCADLPQGSSLRWWHRGLGRLACCRRARGA